MRQIALIFILGIVVSLALLSPQKSYANYNSEATWELIVISSEPVCTLSHYQILEKYYDISEKYLELYQLENKAYPPSCMTDFEYLNEYEKPNDLDLIILVYDREKGRADLHSQNKGGIYIHEGDDPFRNHTIIFCDCSNFEYSNPVWILSHELSHFILNYLGFDLKIVEKEIHDLDEKFDICVEVDYNDSCLSVKTRIETDSSSWVVMQPFEPAIGKSVPPPSSEKAIFDSPFQTKMVIEFTNWWLKGDISNENYVKSLQILSGKQRGEAIESTGILAEPSMLVLSEPPTWKKSQEIEENFSDIVSILAMSPFNEENKNLLSSEEEGIFILWLKTKANSLASGEIEDEDFITDLEYLLNSPKTDLYLNYLDSLSAKELIVKGVEFQESGEFRNALSYFDRAVLRSIDSGGVEIDALILKGSALNALRKYDQALIYFDEALNVEPENFDALKKKSFSLAQLGKIEEAKYYFTLARQIDIGKV